jgi:putative transcriptional regulator
LQNSPVDLERYWQAVIYLVHHSSRGSWGLILNRPSGYTIEQALPRISQTPGGRLLTVFAACAIYVGGFKSDGQSLYVLHGHPLPGAQEISPGVFLGGLEAAATKVLEGSFPATDFRFFVG